MTKINFGARKVGKKGEGLCLMLPSVWIKNAEIKAGEHIFLEMRGKNLIVKPGVKQK